MITKTLIHIDGAKVRFFRSIVVMALLAVLLPACANLANETPAAETGHAAGSVENSIHIYKFATPQDTEMDHFVEAIDDNLFIGVAVSEQAVNEEEPRTLVVYLCDGQDVSQWLVEEITVQEATLIADGTSVELAIADDRVSGTVTLAGGEPQPFAAALATGDAGLYRAEWNLPGADYVADWIVLADGRQRGSIDGKGNDILVFQP